MKTSAPSQLACLVLLFAIVGTSVARADHGPGTSGGGLGTVSGETLPEDRISIELRLDHTEFEKLDHAALERRIFKAGNFDTLERSFLTTLGISYGVFEDFQVGLSLGYYAVVGARTGSLDLDSGEGGIARFDPNGVTDLWIQAKFRFYHGPLGSLAAYAGVKIPTGTTTVKDSLGERIDNSATAGSGAFDGMFGFAYSRWLTKRLSMDASAGFTFRSPYHQFKLGHRLDAGFALACRINEDPKDFPVFVVFGEANFRFMTESEDHREADPNTGGSALFLALGARCSITDWVSVSLAPQVPVLQLPNGTQLETLFKLSLAVNASF